MAIRDLLLKISGDGDDAKRELAAVAKEVAAFGEQEAEAIIGVDATKAETAIDRAKRELRDYGRISVEAAAGVEIAKGEAQIARLTARLENLDKQTASASVEAQTTKAIIALDRVQARVDRLKLAHAEVKVDVDTGPASLINVITSSVAGLVASMGSGGGGLSGATTRISAGFISFGAASGPLAAILAALAVTIGVSLVGALGALIASLAAAVAAVGVLAVALAGALGPVLAVVIAAVARFAKVIQALRAQSAATQQAQQQAAAGASAVTAAAEQQEAAARALTDANQRLGEASTQAYREMADAAEAASDAVRGVADAEQTRAEAGTATRQSVQDLADLRKELGATGQQFDDVFKKFTDVNVDTSGLTAALAAARGSAGPNGPSGADQLKLEEAINRVRRARLNERNAIDGVSDAETNRTRTQQRANEFAREGIRASQGYASALRGVEDAQRQVNAAGREQSLAAAQAKAQVLTDNLSDSERKLLVVLQQVGGAIKTAFGPATDAVLGGLATGLGNVATVATALRPALTAIGAALGQAIAGFGGELVKPEWIAALTQLAEGGAQLIAIFSSDVALPFFEILRDVAVAALPFLIAGTQAFGDLLTGLAANTAGADLTAIFQVLVDNLGAWLQLGLAIGAVFLAFFKSAAGPGKGLVDSLTKGALALAAWLNSKEGMAAVRDFFARTLPVAKEFVRSAFQMLAAFVQFGIAAAPAVKTVLDVLTFLLSHLKEIAIVLLPLGVLFGSTFAIAAAAVIGVIAVIKNFPKILDAIKTAVSAVGGAFKAAFDFAKEQVSAAIQFIGDKFNGFVATAKRIGTRIGNAIVSGLRTALSAVGNVAKTLLNAVVKALNLGVNLINEVTPGEIKVLGHTIFPGFPDIPKIPELAAGGITAGSTFARIGEAGREAILPLTRSVFSDLAAAITAQMHLASPGLAHSRFALPGSPTGNVAGPGVHIDHVDVNVKAAGGGAPDGRHASVLIGRELARLG